MGNTTMRLAYRMNGSGDPLRRWLAAVLILASVTGAYFIFSRDIDWEARNREAGRLAQTYEHNGNYEAACHYYESALANNPYDWRTHLSLATILNRRLNRHDDALRHYLYALAYSPEPSIVESTKAEIDILRLLRTGELENPISALEDMFLAVELGAEEAFGRRLSISIRDQLPAYWEGWSKRGRAKVTQTRIVSSHDGFFDAQMELEFPDDISMSIHLYSPLRDIWRMELAFP